MDGLFTVPVVYIICEAGPDQQKFAKNIIVYGE
jgi:hypothetical protein